ncbi:MAG: helix-turn-helix domain-containing protein [Acidimicrobiales bacterium]
MARSSPGAERVITVLEFFAAHPETRYTLSELARGCGLNKATTHALLTELTGRGVLLRHPDEKRYSLGPRLVPIGEAARRGYHAEDFHVGALSRLAAAAGAEAVAVRYEYGDDHATVIGRAGTGRTSPVPRHWPLVPPNGLVFFAWTDAPSREAWLARCPASAGVRLAMTGLEVARRTGVVIGADIPPWRRLKAALGPGAPRDSDEIREALAELARSPALVLEIDPMATYRDAYVAAPVFDDQGRVTLALAVGPRPDRRRKGEELSALADAVKMVADEMTTAVHGRRPSLD